MEEGGDRRGRTIDRPGGAPAPFPPALVEGRDERVYVAHLNPRGGPMGIRIQFTSEKAAIAFPIRDIVADAVALGSAELVLAHNHPSGNPEPSATDIETTRSLLRVTRPIGIRVKDHLIFGGGHFVSFRER